MVYVHNIRKKGIFLIHTFLSLIFVLAFILFSWYLIIIGIIIYYLQIFLIGNCILTNIEFNSSSKRNSWYHFYLTKLGFKLDRDKVNFFVIYIKPWIILCISLVLQIVFKINPLLF